ncbi:MAG: ABC transporter permease [Erysipelotrichaceae bacterium]|nr:ABC transporter permease [Erysipelotrichaceae bacterium]
MKKKKKADDGRSIYVKKSRMQEVWHQFQKNKGAVVGLIMLIIIIGIAIVSGFVFDYKEDICARHAATRLIKPCLEYPFGTDQMGRSVLARVLYGTRYSLLIGIVVVGVSTGIGTMLGAIAGYYGGKVETVIMRIVEIFMMIPNILLGIIFVAAFGISLTNLMLALGLSTVPHFARTARSSVMTVRGNEYVEAAKAMGVSDFKIIFTHVLPNALSAILVQATTRVASAIISAATFSFIGLGVPSPTPEWGAMLSDARQNMRDFPHLVIFPGLAIMVTVLAINLVGDGLRDALDPKLKR